MNNSLHINRLSPGVRKWIREKGWTELREIQNEAIPLILSADRDLLITAPTAGGKTEAAFLPVISYCEYIRSQRGYNAICISPLKALINDQYERLDMICRKAQVDLTAWHGDANASRKASSWKDPSGILLITPESLEGMMLNRPHEVLVNFSSVQYFIIDEFHSFLNGERGIQLLSLLNRIELLTNRKPMRIALSATIGDPSAALAKLRSSRATQEAILIKPLSNLQNVKVGLSGHCVDGDETETEESADAIVTDEVNLYASYLGPRLRGKSNLVFANSRQTVETLTDRLTSFCESKGVPNEFFAHHGSLAKDPRRFVETRLKESRTPTTAVATCTLELGIDIGDVESVAQVGAPSSISALRQRMGRSGRREGTFSILRCLVPIRGKNKNAAPNERLELEMVQAVAILSLLLENKLEPENQDDLHTSTFIQQLLSIIVQFGGQRADVLFRNLCETGPFGRINASLFADILRSLAAKDIVVQLQNGEIFVGKAGEHLVSHYSFVTAFQTPTEYRIIYNGKTLGTISKEHALVEGQLLIFAGRRWKVKKVDLEAKTIVLGESLSGKAPKFGGEAAPVHAMIQERMREILRGSPQTGFCDEEALKALVNACEFYKETGLDYIPFHTESDSVWWFLWGGDKVQTTLLLALMQMGYENVASDKCCLIFKGSVDPATFIARIRSTLQKVNATTLVKKMKLLGSGKHDHLLSREILEFAFANSEIDNEGAIKYLDDLESKLSDYNRL